ncbi:MAG: 2-hydroxyacyl-CoA dehydratase family protein [Pseudomonadota bacterium]
MIRPGPNSILIGITSTIPVEIVLASGLKPVDLNNVFINSEKPEKLISQAEAAGFPHNICAWIKGIYATVMNQDLKAIIAVTGGDCSNTIALSEVLSRRGVEVIGFEYPLNRDKNLLMVQMEKLRNALSTSWDDIRRMKLRLDGIRAKLRELDRLTFEANVITGFENHLFLVNSSDFNSDPDLYEKRLDEFLMGARTRRPKGDEIRLGYLGVPPIFGQFYEYIESLGARIVFNETQRQFSMPYEIEDILELYLRYTYPYDIEGRIKDIKNAIHERKLDGLIHYTQTFCFRQIYDIILRESLPLPMLTLEGDRPGPIDSRTAIRIETFIHMLKDRKHG